MSEADSAEPGAAPAQGAETARLAAERRALEAAIRLLQSVDVEGLPLDAPDEEWR